MSNIHFPSDHPPVSSATGKNKTQQPLQHTDAVNEDPQQQKKQDSGKKKHSPQPAVKQKQTEKNQPQQTTHGFVARSEDRRIKNRRQHQQSALLDTRSGQDRRKTHGQRKDDVIDENTSFGIDTKA